MIMTAIEPGLIVLLGSGETLPSSGKTHEFVAQRLPKSPRIVVLETPAGFEPNSDAVAGKIKDFLARRLQNYKPVIDVLPARRRGTPFSPDNPDIVAPILKADEILLGPGSPTYGARQLQRQPGPGNDRRPPTPGRDALPLQFGHHFLWRLHAAGL